MREAEEDCDGEPAFGLPCPQSCAFERGTEIWAWTEETLSFDRAGNVAVANTGEVFLAGSTEAKALGPYLVSLDSDGTKQWSLTAGEIEEGFMFGAVQVANGQVVVHGQGLRLNEARRPESALLRAAYSMEGDIAWHSYRFTGEPDYEQLSGPIVDVNNRLYFLSIEEQFGDGRSPAVLATSSFQGDFEDEVLLEAPPINRLVRFGDWTQVAMSTSTISEELHIGGAAFRNDGSDHAVIERRSTDGSAHSSTLYRNPASRPARYVDLAEVPLEGVAAVGSRRTDSGSIPMVHYYNLEGELLWEFEPNLEEDGSQNTNAAVAAIDNDTIAVVGSRESPESGGVDGWIGCISVETGELEWEQTFRVAPTSFWTYPQDIVQTQQGLFIVAGYGSDDDAAHDAFARAITL